MTILQYIFGEVLPGDFIACYLFALLGAYISLNIDANGRRISSSHTPISFSYRTLFACNWSRIVFNLVFIYVCLRFTTELTGWKLTTWKALLIGGGLDRIIMYYKKLTKK